jgi:hypothetical protein
VGRYVRQFDVTVTHDGEPITATLKPPTVQDVLGFDSKLDQTRLYQGFRERLSENIVELKGPVDAAGTQVPKDEFLNAAYFMTAMMELGTEWLKRAMPANPSLPGV